MTAIGRSILAIASLALPAALGSCGSDTSMQHTNATTTEQLNQIADNTSSTAGADQTHDGSAAAVAAQSTRPTKPRKY